MIQKSTVTLFLLYMQEKVFEVFLLYEKVLFSPVLLKKVMAAAVGANSPHALFLHMSEKL